MNLNLPMVTTYDGLVDKTNYQIRIALHFSTLSQFLECEWDHTILTTIWPTSKSKGTFGLFHKEAWIRKLHTDTHTLISHK